MLRKTWKLQDRAGTQSSLTKPPAPDAAVDWDKGESGLYIDAGVGSLRLWGRTPAGEVVDLTLSSNRDVREIIQEYRIGERFLRSREIPVMLTGKLAPLMQEALGCGKTLLPAATAWLAAKDMLQQMPESIRSLACIDLSASGYLVVGVDRSGALKDDLLVVNPRCGAGSGINLDRVIQKLGLGRGDVDALLAGFAGGDGRQRRQEVTIRADRCGVFSSSATISDKNQGIPLEMALATTLKSEVLKACRKLPAGYDRVCLTGRVFLWRFARECAEDYLREQGVREVIADPGNDQLLISLRGLARRVGTENLAQPESRLCRQDAVSEYPALAELKARYEADHRYLRQADAPLCASGFQVLATRPVHLALDVGSTMAKAVIADAASGEIHFLNAYSNAGDTIDTIKQVFRDLRQAGLDNLQVRGIGITGSARYQVQQALEHLYPELSGRIHLLVENYAHARGSIALAREHVQRLKDLGINEVDENLCILVDIGGEDTKVSTIALKEAELFNNAMNLKCSAGTGSLMDTLSAMFSLPSIADACAEAFAAPKALAINATCAVFLMENARKLQVQGVPRDVILASANWAIVENMARTLWAQVDLPKHTVVLLHGQTMLSEPLPLAVTHRLQSYLGAPAYALVPPNPGHRACFGLIRTLEQTAPADAVTMPLYRLLESSFEKRIIQCHGAACDDKTACCNRTQLTCRADDGAKRLSFTLGGCSAINELLAKQKEKTPAKPVRDTYKEIWDFVDAHHPRSEDPNRLVIPRSFAVSEWAYLFARIFVRLGLPVHVDNVQDRDLIEAQPLFNIDTCAPHIGAVGQYRRLAREPHGMILGAQIEYLPTGGASAGRTCTTNQGGIAVAMNLARLASPEARFHLFNIDLGRLEATDLLAQMRTRLAPVFQYYGIRPDEPGLAEAIDAAIADHRRLRQATADLAADMAEEALAQQIPIALVVGREYILNPGIYDSHVRRLLRDKHMAVLPAYVLDLELNPDYSHIYWRNPHFIVSLLDAVAHRKLHERLHHPRLRQVFASIEAGPDLLPVVQVSTFSCGPDSVVQPFIAEIMRQRPFLLIQSDAVIKELAHLENRVNTYVKQLQLRLYDHLHTAGAESFQIHTLDDLVNSSPIDRDKDVIYFPTLSDNRVLTSILRGAGYTCIDNYGEGYDLHQLVRQGRRTTGDAVCAPLAAVYADLERAVADFAQRRQDNDPLTAGKQRLLYFDNKGPGPCRQGQYSDVHRLLWHKHATTGSDQTQAGCPASPIPDMVRFLIARDSEGYNIGLAEWLQARVHLGVILQGVMHGLLFAGGAACRDYAEYQRFLAEHRRLKKLIYNRLERFSGPLAHDRALLKITGRSGPGAWLGKYFAYHLSGSELWRPLRQFASRWLPVRLTRQPRFRIAITGEGYMRAAQAEEIFRILLANLGFQRFSLTYTPVWSYMEWCFDEYVETQRDRLDRHQAGTDAGELRANIRSAIALKFVLRNMMARPLYQAARLPMPLASSKVMHATQELIPTLRPLSEISTYVGEALDELREGTDLVLNVGPNGCMVASMGEVLTPAIAAASGPEHGRIQHLFSADGDVNEELLSLALLKSMGPETYYTASPRNRATAH